MSFITIVIIAVAIFYILSKGFIKNPAGGAHKKFNFSDASFLITLLAKIAKADGVVKSAEAAYISQMLDILTDELKGDEATRTRLKSVYEGAKNSSDSVYKIAQSYKAVRMLSPNECQSVVIYLLNLAYADGVFSANERAAIDDICAAFGISDIIKRNLFSRFESEFSARYGSYEQSSRSSYKNSYNNSYNASSAPNAKDPYEVLGLSKTASFDEVKKRYRKLAREYHPDFLGSDAHESVVSEATKKLQEINEAYEKIKAKEGK